MKNCMVGYSVKGLWYRVKGVRCMVKGIGCRVYRMTSPFDHSKLIMLL